MRLAAKAVLLLSLLALAFFGAITVVVLHDYYIATDMPWREGDFRQTMTTSLSGLIFSFVGATVSLVFLKSAAAAADRATEE
ncbi:MAG: hypothetical protein Kow00114_18600 [Kiloniellaceae bacterium]